MYVAETTNGEVMLRPTVGSEFGTVPTDWFVTPWTPGGGAVVADGKLIVDGALAGHDSLHQPGRSLEFVATFTELQQHIGFGTDFSAGPWAIFSTDGSNTQLFARTNPGAGDGCPVASGSCTPLGSALFGSPHRFRIVWTSTVVTYFVDGAQVASHAIAIGASMRPLAASDLNLGGGSLY